MSEPTSRATTSQPNAAAYIDGQALETRYSMSLRHIQRLIQLGEFPAPRKFGRLNRWSLADLDEFDARASK